MPPGYAMPNLSSHVVPSQTFPNAAPMRSSPRMLGSPDLGNLSAVDVYRRHHEVHATTFDAVDGKQARRTNSSSPLGELFDHGCDALACALEALAFASTAMCGRTSFWFWVISAIPFYFATWEHHPLQSSLQNLKRNSGGTVKRTRHGKPQSSDDFECTLCLKLLYEPVTTPCGHSFCRSCLFQSMDHGNKCPMCRTVLFVTPGTYPTSVTLNNIIQKNFPEEYAERKAEQDSLTNSRTDIMPLFVMDVVLPCQKLSLNIFKPRYKFKI